METKNIKIKGSTSTPTERDQSNEYKKTSSPQQRGKTKYVLLYV